uniref:PLAT domain-containing protein n=1 Tax=Eptatretus burgeri TaxID=7764 RepID=A0A8C4R1V7_EPTBU
MYIICVKTGDQRNAGTDSDVFIILFGDRDDTGLLSLKSSKTNKNKFERGCVDEFTLEAVNLGPTRKILIGHNNRGGSSGWFLDWVNIDAPSLGQRMHLPCGRWLDKREDDGAVERILYPNHLRMEYYTPFVPYEIRTCTGDVRGAGTNADVFVVLYGRDRARTSRRSLCRSKQERHTCFNRSAVDIFVLLMEDVGETIEKIRIGHDGSGLGSGWFLNQVEIRRLLPDGQGSRRMTFPCQRWLAHSEDDGEILRELVPSIVVLEVLNDDGEVLVTENAFEDPLQTLTYKVCVYTGDVRGAGTDANVFLTIYGDQGDTGERKLSKSETNTNKFEKGKEDRFSFEAIDIGNLYKINIRHDNSLLGAGWFLERVEVTVRDDTSVFYCERWLSRRKEEGCIERILHAQGYNGNREEEDAICLSQVDHLTDNVLHEKNEKSFKHMKNMIPYYVVVTTGPSKEHSTKSRGFVILLGTRDRRTRRLWLDSADGKAGFRPDSSQKYRLLGQDIGELRNVELGHDGITAESCWFVEELEVVIPLRGFMYVIPCKCWFAKDRDDGCTTRTFSIMDASCIPIMPKVLYEVTVFTGDTHHGGTDANIFMSIFGAVGVTEDMQLMKNGSRFERGQADVITMEIDDVAPLQKIRVRTDGKGCRPHWFLEKILMRSVEHGEETTFFLGDWLSRSWGSKQLVRDMAAVVEGEPVVDTTSYTITVKTSDLSGAGTDANVSLLLFGEHGDSGILRLKHSAEHSNKFERGNCDSFCFTNMLSVGELAKIRIWHDNSGFCPGWHLDSVEVWDDVMGSSFRFHCDRWLAVDEDDGQTLRELSCRTGAHREHKDNISYKITVETSDGRDSGTKENVWLVMEGKNKCSDEFLMENSSKPRKFQRGGHDVFVVESEDVGDVQSIILGHCPRRKSARAETLWQVHQVIIMNMESGNKYICPCDTRLSLSASREDGHSFHCHRRILSFASRSHGLLPSKYEVLVVTGDSKNCGTDANVFITMYGMNGDSGRRALRQKYRNLFEGMYLPILS